MNGHGTLTGLERDRSGDSLDLRGYLQQLEKDCRGGIAYVKRAVRSNRELAAVVKKLESLDDRVVWFENVDGLGIPVIGNLFGSRDRIAAAIGAEGMPYNEVTDLFLRRLGEDTPAQEVDTGPVKDNCRTGEDVDLGQLPVSVHAPEDAGPYFTAGVCLVRDPESGATNGGIYRMMIKGPRRFTVSVGPGHDLGDVIAWGREHDRPVEIAVVLGYHPALAIASQAKAPISRDIFSVMGSLVGRSVPVVDCESVDLQVPADAEIVVEGAIAPGAEEGEGPFGEFTYYYGGGPADVCEVSAITHRSDPLYIDIHPTHQEHRSLWLFPGRQARLLALLRQTVPSVQAVNIPEEGAAMVAWISMAKEHNGDSKRALLVALSSDAFIKHAVIVDDDIDVFDPGQVLWALGVRFQADQDLIVVPNLRGYAEDPTTYGITPDDSEGGLTTKMGYDATAPMHVGFPRRADLIPDEYSHIDPAAYVTDDPSEK